MRLLDRYILSTIAGGVALVLGALLTLVALFMFIGQQSDVGTGDYGSLQAIRYVLLSLPAQCFEFLPMAALIGTLLGMGLLARNSELTVMRASGISIGRIGGSMTLAGVLMMVLAFVLAEYIAPAASDAARTGRALDRYASISFAGRGGAWVRDGELILKAEQRSREGLLRGITIFEMDGNHLVGVGRAGSAAEIPGGGWELRDYRASGFVDDAVTQAHAPSRRLHAGPTTAFLAMTAADPMELSMRELSQAVRYLRSNGQESRPQRFAFWSIAARVVAVPLAVLLALPFLFGSLRSTGSGARVTLGLVLGLAYFILQRMVLSGTIAFGLDPVLLAWLPTLLLAVTVVVLIWRLPA